jgi:hypothetical protein
MGDYEVGYGKPLRQAGLVRNPKGRPRGSKNIAILPSQALDEKVMVTEGGRWCRVTKRKLVTTHLVNKSASADLRAIPAEAFIERVVGRQLGPPAGSARERVDAEHLHPQCRAELARLAPGTADTDDEYVASAARSSATLSAEGSARSAAQRRAGGHQRPKAAGVKKSPGSGPGGFESSDSRRLVIANGDNGDSEGRTYHL